MSLFPNVRRVAISAACATALAIGTLGAVVSTAPADASTAKPLVTNLCGTSGSGVTSWSNSVAVAQWAPLRSVWVKQPPGCHDYNIVEVSATGNYAGYLEQPSGLWDECDAGYILIPAATPGDWVECSNVATGTHMTTDTTQFPGGVSYQVNY